MKFNLFTLLLVVAFVCACHGAEIPPPTVPENGDVVRTYQGVNVYKTERACARQGGLCVQKDDCKSLTAIKGLCPENANRGVECCYEVNPPKGLRCRQYDGKCDRWCHRVQQMPAVDCAEGLVCCAVIPSEAVHTCAEHLGECMTGCRALNLARKATDCAEGETCCVLVV